MNRIHITRDRASAYAKAIEEILPDCMQIADRFHLHQNLMDAVRKILGREIPATNAITIEESTIASGHAEPEGSDEGAEPVTDMERDMVPDPVPNSEEAKKIPC